MSRVPSLLAGFEVTTYGRFWVTAEGQRCPKVRLSNLRLCCCAAMRFGPILGFRSGRPFLESCVGHETTVQRVTARKEEGFVGRLPEMHLVQPSPGGL